MFRWVVLYCCIILCSAKLSNYSEKSKYNDLEPKRLNFNDFELLSRLFLGAYEDELWVMNLDRDGLNEVKLRPGTQSEDIEFEDLFGFQIERYENRQKRIKANKLNSEAPNQSSSIKPSTQEPSTEVSEKKQKDPKLASLKSLGSTTTDKKKLSSKLPSSKKPFLEEPSNKSLPSVQPPISSAKSPSSVMPSSKLPSSSTPDKEELSTSVPSEEKSRLLGLLQKSSTNNEEEIIKTEIMKIVNKFVLSAHAERNSNTASGDEYDEPSLTLYFKGAYSALTVRYNDNSWHYFIAPPSPLPKWFYEELPKMPSYDREMYVKPPKDVVKEFYKKFLRLVQVFLGHPV